MQQRRIEECWECYNAIEMARGMVVMVQYNRDG